MRESSDDDLSEQGVNEPDWEDVMFESEKPVYHLDATDYVALFIAALQTIFLPLVILAVVLVAMGLIFSTFFG
ncbi:MAG: hypothetical protein ACFFED_11705 [Candidatus Thorarchaeota archaeon]